MRMIWLLTVATVVCLLFLAGGYFNKIKKRIALLGAMICIFVGGGLLLLAVLPGNSFYGKVLYKGTTKEKLVALTFDDGPYPPYTEQILAVLKEKKVPATFFLVGENAKAHPDLVREEEAQGHLLGTHTYDHKDLLRLSGSEIRSELSAGVKIVEDITGEKTIFVRPPHGFSASRSGVGSSRASRTAPRRSAIWHAPASGNWRPPPIPNATALLPSSTPSITKSANWRGGSRRYTTTITTCRSRPPMSTSMRPTALR